MERIARFVPCTSSCFHFVSLEDAEDSSREPSVAGRPRRCGGGGGATCNTTITLLHPIHDGRKARLLLRFSLSYMLTPEADVWL
jgi:hypothetical protein